MRHSRFRLRPVRFQLKRLYRLAGKRTLDVLGSLLGLVLLSPVLAAVALLVRVKLGRPVIFKQDRPGLHEKIFTLYKFRTMTGVTDAQGRLLEDGARLTAFGKLLRAASLDELPELWNILKGDMSIVGPRPLLTEYLPLYSAEQKTRHSVRPGLTGYAQVNGRNQIGWAERFRYDAAYVRAYSFSMDLLIILKTVGHVFQRKGINSATAATMEPFTGNDAPAGL